MRLKRNLPQLKGKVKIVGKNSSDMISYIESLGISEILSNEAADVIIVAEEGFVPNIGGKKMVCPYYEKLDKSQIKAEKILTCAVENNSADVVAKNIRKRDDFTTFELLAPDGIGRVYVGSENKNLPKYALSLACGLMLAGAPTTDAIAMVSEK